MRTERPQPALNNAERRTLLHLARATIDAGVSGRAKPKILLNEYPATLRARRAVFVTLTLNGQLRGCIGTLQAEQPLVQAVVDAAWNAAFNDPRFNPLSASELDQIEIEISILSPPEPLPATSRQALLSALKPGIDGLIIEDGSHRATFLPQVWQQLPDAESFLCHLLAKAGLPTNYWSDSLRCYRYYATGFCESDITDKSYQTRG